MRTTANFSKFSFSLIALQAINMLRGISAVKISFTDHYKEEYNLVPNHERKAPNSDKFEKFDESDTSKLRGSLTDELNNYLEVQNNNNMIPLTLGLNAEENCCSIDGGNTCGEDMGFLCRFERFCEGKICDGNWISSIPKLSYGDLIYLQVNHMDNRWLSGGRSNGNEMVVSRDHFGSDYEEYNAAETYRWIVRSSPGDGSRSFSDENNGNCVKYGEKVYLQVNYMDDRWLSGGRSNGNEMVVSRDHFGSDYEEYNAAETYRWIIRSSPGDGSRSFSDENEGSCVKYQDKIYLQVNYMDDRWLSGGRGNGNEMVISRDHFSTDYEVNDAAETYRWIVRDSPGDGSRTTL